jgi:hypothetical protein
MPIFSPILDPNWLLVSIWLYLRGLQSTTKSPRLLEPCEQKIAINKQSFSFAKALMCFLSNRNPKLTFTKPT